MSMRVVAKIVALTILHLIGIQVSTETMNCSVASGIDTIFYVNGRPAARWNSWIRHIGYRDVRVVDGDSLEPLGHHSSDFAQE